MVTKKDVADLFTSFVNGRPCFCPEVHQVDNKQLFVVSYPDYQLLVSYLTIVGIRTEGAWLLTTRKYSVTTSRQLTQFVKSLPVVGWVEQSHLEELVEAAQSN